MFAVQVVSWPIPARNAELITPTTTRPPQPQPNRTHMNTTKTTTPAARTKVCQAEPAKRKAVITATDLIGTSKAWAATSSRSKDIMGKATTKPHPHTHINTPKKKVCSTSTGGAATRQRADERT